MDFSKSEKNSLRVGEGGVQFLVTSVEGGRLAAKIIVAFSVWFFETSESDETQHKIYSLI